MAQELKSVHEIIRSKLNSQRQNGLKSILHSHLYDLMPENKEQMKKFPKLRITLDANLVLPVSAAIRTRTRPRRVAPSTKCSFANLKQQIETMQDIAQDELFEDDVTNSNVIKAILEGMGYNLSL